MSLHALATNMASKGRNGDSMLVHMTPGEVHGLQALAMKHGGTLTINPDTGLPEANFLKSLLPMLAGFALGPAGFGLVSSGLTAGAIVGGVTGLATGSLSKGLMAGLGAYGGFGVGESLAGLGAAEMSAGTISSQMPTLAEGATQAQIDAYAQQVNALRSQALAAANAPGAIPNMDKLSAGFSSATASPMDAFNFAKDNKMALGMAAAPIMADMMVPTTTKASSPMAPGRIVEKRWNGREFVPVASTDAGVFNTSGRTFSDLYRGYNGGGIVALAEGGKPSAGMQYAAANNIDVGANIDKWIQDNPFATTTDINNAIKTSGLTQADVNPFLTANTKISDATRYALSHASEMPGAGGLAGMQQNILTALARNPNMTQSEIDAAQAQYKLSDYDIQSPLIHGYQVANDQTAAAQKYIQDNPDVARWISSDEGKAYLKANPQFDASDIAYTHFQRYGEDEGRKWGGTNATQTTTGTVTTPTNIDTATSSVLPVGVSGAGITTINPNGTVTTRPNIPGIPEGGFTGMKNLRDVYTAGGGSLGYTSPVPTSLDAFNKTYATDRMSGDSLAAYNYLAGKGGATYPTKSGFAGQLSQDYATAVLGYPARGNLPYIYNKATGRMDPNPDYVAPGRTAAGDVTYSMSLNDIKSSLKETPLSGQALYDWAMSNNLTAQQIADATGRSLSSVYSDFRAGSKAKADADKKKTDDDAAAAAVVSNQNDGGGNGGDGGGPAKEGGLMGYAMGGMPSYAIGGGLGSLGSYSDGGRLLKGPGDGVSDSIPATIGRKRQPARLADGEFVIPARIVSELGNGSTDAGAKKLYAMMDRVQRARGKTTGKNKVAANSRADKYLPA
jgi:hypothetical protein